MTVSFWYRIPVNFSGSLSAQLNWSTAADTKLTDVGVSYTSAASITLTNTTAWTYASFTTFVPLAAQALSVMFTNYPPGGSTVNGAQFQFTGVQLEKGSVATPFEVRPYATELALCQRYFEKSFNDDVAPANVSTGFVQGFSDGVRGWNSSTTGVKSVLYFKVTKRANPVMTFYNAQAGGTAGTWSAYDTADRVNLVPTAYPYQQKFSVSLATTGLTAGAASMLIGNWTASAEL